MFCANADGTDEYELALIEKFLNPRCFKNESHLPVMYYAQQNAWTDKEIYKKCVQQLDKTVAKKGRKILLFMNNVSSHVPDIPLKSITVHLFPPNTTSLLQPLDQG